MNLTDAQRQAVEARGNVLVSASAGTGKTGTLVARILSCLGAAAPSGPRVSLDEILVVTFTDAAAAEMRARLRAALEEKRRAPVATARPGQLRLFDAAPGDPGDPHWEEQLALFDTAHIGTLHSFCFQLVRRHFYELDLDPQLSVLDAGEARLLAQESIDAVLQRHYAADDAGSEAVRQLVESAGGVKSDRAIRALILRLHDYLQTRPDPAAWMAAQFKLFDAAEPEPWRGWLRDGIADWRDEWEPRLQTLAPENPKAAECLALLRATPRDAEPPRLRVLFDQLKVSAETWPARKKMALKIPLEDFFDDAEFLGSLVAGGAGAGARDPLLEDWNWTRGHLTTLLRLAGEFEEHFSRARREAGAVDFHDLEQFALRLLWDFKAGRPTPIAAQWRKKIRFVFVDEYQDINAAQDKIIEALSRDGAEANRFLVGDVKQSIYRFRLADPAIFAGYESGWSGKGGRTLSLVENFRSRAGILKFINDFFARLMRPGLGGVDYAAGAQLRPGATAPPADPEPCVELRLRLKGRSDVAGRTGESAGAGDEAADAPDTEADARLLALRLKELKAARFEIRDRERNTDRPVDWRDMAVLLRAPSRKAESYAKAFAQAGVPLAVERGGFYESSEIADLLELLKLLDNPLQDVPAMAVLRSPLVGLSLDELAAIRLAAPRENFWSATLERQKADGRRQKGETDKVDLFLERFARWRNLARQDSLSRCLETILAETRYEDWLRGQNGGARRRAKVRQFVGLARRFDEFQRQGLFRFLRFVEAQQEAGAEPEIAAAIEENAVRLMSIHQSKGLEFPVVALADVGKPFNFSDLRSELTLDERFGLCPQITPPDSVLRYPSLPLWLARRRQTREMLGEELRLLYVAMTRAADLLILTGSVSEKKWTALWNGDAEFAAAAGSPAVRSYSDWIGAWFARSCAGSEGAVQRGSSSLARWVFDDGAPRPTGTGPENGASESGNGPDAEAWRSLQPRLEWEYPFAPATRRPAKASVSVLRRQAAERWDEEAQPFFDEDFVATRSSGMRIRPAGAKSGTDLGAAHHKFLQYVSLEHPDDADFLRREAARLERERLLSPEEAASLNFEAIAAFWQSAPGRKLRAQSVNVRRELAFTARFAASELARVTGEAEASAPADEFVVVQGVADLAVVLPEEIWLMDFKTDAVEAGGLAARAKSYEPQLKLYAAALARIYGRPVTDCFLHFLSPRETVRVAI